MSFEPTLSGWLLLDIWILTGGMALWTGNNYFSLLYCFFGGLFLFSGLACWLRLRRLQYSRSFPDRYHALSPGWHRIHVEAPHPVRIPIRISVKEDITTERESWFDEQMSIGDGHINTNQNRTATSVRLRPRHRGSVPLNALVVSSTYPMGLIRCRFRIPLQEEVTVFPRQAKFRPSALPDLMKRTRTSGGTRSPQPDQFAGLREYRKGDDPRRIYWKSLARPSQQLLVKLFDALPGGRCLMLIETAVLEHRKRRREWIVENILGGSLALLEELLRRGFDVRVRLNMNPSSRFSLIGGRDSSSPVEHAMINADPSRKRGFMELNPKKTEEVETVICTGFRVRSLYADALWAPNATWLDLQRPESTAKLSWASNRKLPGQFQR